MSYEEDHYKSELEYLNSRSLEGEWKVIRARFFSRCQHCGEAIDFGERFFWHPDGVSTHIDCVDLMQGLEHALSRYD